MTDQQTGGRGRGTNQWWSDEGSLTFSLLAPSLSIEEECLPQVALAAGVAICQAVERFLPDARVRLKWPNDIFVDGKKVGGILIESTSQKPRRLVIGVGLNVNNTFDNAPDEVVESATSLLRNPPPLSVGGVRGGGESPLDGNIVLIECLKRIEQRLHQLVANWDSLPDLWRRYSLLTGKQVQVETAQKQLSGLCKGIADDGALLIQINEEIVPCYTGVVTRYD